jgi:hypothetical protein
MVKWGYDGHIPLIYLILLAMKRTHIESLEACTSVYHGAHRCTLGAHGSEGAYTPVPPGGGGRPRLHPRGGTHTCSQVGARTSASRGGCARLCPLKVGRGSILGGGISYPLLFCFFTFLGLKWALGWLYSPIKSKFLINE